MKEAIEKKLADYRQGLEWMQKKHAEAVQGVKMLEAAILKQQGAIEGLEALLGEGDDADQDAGAGFADDDAGEPGRVDN